jgi:RNA polymerase sigma-70 factor (sigma-E family)
LAREEEFRTFAAARYSALVRTAFLLVGDRGCAEDLAQSTLIKTYLAWGRLRAPENADAYARRVLVRLAIRSLRRRWAGEIPTENIAGPAADPAAGDIAIDVRRALAALPGGQRAVLVLRYLDDRSEAETAALLGISIGTVKSRAFRGLKSLRRTGLLDAEVADFRRSFDNVVSAARPAPPARPRHCDGSSRRWQRGRSCVTGCRRISDASGSVPVR